MKKITRLLLVVLVLAIALSSFAACANSSPEAVAKAYIGAINSKNADNLAKLYDGGDKSSAQNEIDAAYGIYELLKGKIKKIEYVSIDGKEEEVKDSKEGITAVWYGKVEFKISFAEKTDPITEQTSLSLVKKDNKWLIG